MIKNPPFWDKTLSSPSDTLILNSAIDYVISAERFDDSILTHCIVNTEEWLQKPKVVTLWKKYLWILNYKPA